MGNENSHEGGQRPAHRPNNGNRRAPQPQPQQKGFTQILADGINRIQQQQAQQARAQAQANRPKHVIRGAPPAQTQDANRLIQKQQETILKQQALIAQQQTQNMKLLQATQLAASTDKRGGSGQNKNNKQKNQQSGSGPGAQLIGEYQCPQCTTQWKGNNAKIGVPKQCKKCEIDVYPQNVTSTVSSAQVKGQNVQINVTATVVASGSATSAGNAGQRGEYNCGQCSAKWIAFAKNGVPRVCNKCQTNVYPVILPKGSSGPNKKSNNKVELGKAQDTTVNNNLNNPNNLWEKCDNKKMNWNNDVVIGEFRCPNCSIAWKAVWQNVDQQCNKCKMDVRPWTLI